MDWAQRNREDILAGTANYQGTAITPETQMVQYRGVVSALVLTVVAPTDHYVVGSSAATRMRIASTVFSAILGWWGFPWGLIRTPVVIYGNLTDEYRIVVSELLQEG